MSTTSTNGHFKNLPRKGTIVSLLDRQSKAVRHGLVVARVKRNGKLRLAFLGSNGKINYTIAVPNGSSWAEDKTVRFRWAYSTLTSPQYSEELSSSSDVKTGTKTSTATSQSPTTAQSTGPRAQA